MSQSRQTAGESLQQDSKLDFLLSDINEQQLWMDVYTRQFPDVSDVEAMAPEEQREALAELRDEVELLEVEAAVFARNAELLCGKRLSAAAALSLSGTKKSFSAFFPGEHAGRERERNSLSEVMIEAAADPNAESWTQSTAAAAPPARRGQAYSRKLLEVSDVYVTLEDRVAMLTKEKERLRQQREKDEREEEHLRELLTATVKEAVGRIKELHLETLQFNREVLNEGETRASADDLLRYMERRYNAQAAYLDKLNVQCAAAERSIMQSQQQLRQRNAAGEAFRAIDFEQLRIENQQFNERIERKNLELVELKGTSTRTVQTLNSLMDTLNGLTSEQNRLKKDYKNRCEYLARLKREMISVTHDADVAERKNAAIKAQHEAVRVPKIEHYVAQKAEEYELKKADRNWKRKVEIAEGQLRLVRQQIRLLAKATRPPQKLDERVVRKPEAPLGSYSKANAEKNKNNSLYIDSEGKLEVRIQAGGSPVVGGSRGLLNLRRSA